MHDALPTILATVVLTFGSGIVVRLRGYVTAIHNAQKDISEIREHLNFPRAWEDREKRYKCE